MKNFEGMEKNEDQEGSEKVLLRLLLQRHGPKMSAAGEKDETALYFGASVEKGFKDMDIKDGEGLIHISSSPIKRAMDTANIELGEVSKTGHRYKGRVGKKEGLATPFREGGDDKYSQDLRKIVEMQASLEPSVRERVEKEYPNLNDEEKEAEVRNLIDTEVLSILFNEQEAKKQGIQTSYEEMADNLGKRYGGLLKHTELLNSLKEQSDLQPQDEPYTQIDVSHSFPIMSLLKKFLVFNDGTVAKDLSPKDFFEKVGGVIRESGSLELDYKLEGDRYSVKAKGSFAPDKGFAGQLNFNQ